jgi:aminoglycoside phosphotransferase (APT) family kinase protein
VSAGLQIRAQRARPPDRTLDWAARAVGADAPGCVVNVRPLTGGVASSVHALDVVDGDGQRHQLVLRRHLDDEDADGRRAEFIDHEAAVLTALTACALPTPCLVATDPSGEHAGAPALLMTRLPGRMLLDPKDPASWAQQIAAALPHIHALTPNTDWTEQARDADRLEIPTWARDPAVWREALAIAQQPGTEYEPCFVHGDFQHFNLVWSREQLTGVVDWTFSGVGMPEHDVGHCRLNIAILWGADAAEDFRLRYESAAGRQTDPYWDLQAALGFLPGWGDIIQTQAGRRLRVDTPGINGRVEDLVATILRRM